MTRLDSTLLSAIPAKCDSWKRSALLKEKGLKHSRKFTWEKVAHDTNAVYKKIFDI